jgi:hypothetical protein
MDEIDKARKFDNKGFQWTRRIIALTAVFFIIAFPKLLIISCCPLLLEVLVDMLDLKVVPSI